MRSQGRTPLVFALAASLAFVSGVAPPAHVHEADVDHAPVVHRHFDTHDHDSAAISHDEEQVVWLDEVGLAPATHEFALAPAILTAVVGSLPASHGWTAVSGIETAPPHGPPRQPSSPRAPPLPAC
ncbi:MAG: hypothetical protein WBD07_03600 [Vicinamibacterales bacterium]